MLNISDEIKEYYSKVDGLDDFGLCFDKNEECKKSILNYLNFSGEEFFDTYLTYSASLSLSCSLTTLSNRSENGGEVIVLAPVFDVIPLLIKNLKKLKPVYLKKELNSETLRDLINERTVGLVVCSPSNPLGIQVNPIQIETIKKICVNNGLTVIIDQSFYGVVNANRESLLINNFSKEGDWICIWDTGKTFGLANDKVSTVFCSKAISEEFSENLSLIQYSLPIRTVSFFRNFLSSHLSINYLSHLRFSINENYIYACEKLKPFTVYIFPLGGASFFSATLNSTKYKNSTKMCFHILDRTSVASIPIDIFENTMVDAVGFRLALSREIDYFRNAIDKLEIYLGEVCDH